MSRTSQLITDEIVELAKQELKKLGKNGNDARKLSAICAAKEHGIKEVSKIYGLSRTTLTKLDQTLRKRLCRSVKAKTKKNKSFDSRR
jgi:hypothetical protein